MLQGEIQNRWWFGDAPQRPIPGAKGFSMFVGNSIQDVVAFLGWRDPNRAGGIKPEGTGFLLHYGGQGYIVTARHVATKLGTDPFVVRINKYKREAQLIDADQVQWHYPADPLVDLAVTQVNFGDPLYFPDSAIYSKERHVIDVGDFCYTVGLFHFIAGHTRNLPFVFTGHIALMPPVGEKIPVGNENGGVDYVEGYLIENSAIKGVSGAPVFVRQSTALKMGGKSLNVLAGTTNLFLMGVYQAAWFSPPDPTLRQEIGASPSTLVPLGFGVVVPVHKLVELLETQELIEMRAKSPKVEIVPATPAGLSSSEEGLKTGDSDANPNHLEDFKRLVDVAARKRPQGDQT
jgi:hypothetical protein